MAPVGNINGFHQDAELSVARAAESKHTIQVLSAVATMPMQAIFRRKPIFNGLIVSNHGGRAEETGRATLECLPEVVEAVANRIPVLLDGGIR